MSPYMLYKKLLRKQDKNKSYDKPDRKIDIGIKNNLGG